MLCLDGLEFWQDRLVCCAIFAALSFVNTMCAEPAQLFRNLQVLGADGYAVCSRMPQFLSETYCTCFVGILTIRPVVTH